MISQRSTFFINTLIDENTQARHPATVDGVFLKIVGFYRDYFNKILDLKANAERYGLISENLHFQSEDFDEDYQAFLAELDSRIIFDESGTIDRDNEIRLYRWRKRCKLDERLMRRYGFDTSNQLPEFRIVGDQVQYPEWYDFTTYAEYVTYWNGRINNDSTLHAPFSIYDYSNPTTEFLRLEDGSDGIANPTYDTGIDSEICDWYIPCSQKLIASPHSSVVTDHCDQCRIDTTYGERCLQLQKLIRADQDPISSSGECIRQMLGKICVRSKFTYITSYIVNKIKIMSDYSCDNMVGYRGDTDEN